MYKISIEKDHDKTILFLDALTFIPAIGPDSDMDGHDLSSLTYNETLRAEEFVERFNEYCADKAKLIRFMGLPVIVVKDFYPKELDIDGDDDEEDEFVKPATPEEFEEMKTGITSSWVQMFNMTPEEIETYWKEFERRFN